MSVKIGKPKFGSDFVRKNYWKLKDGDQVFRILPPLGDLAEEGRWSTFWNIHYGYKGTDGKLKPFQSPLVKNRKSKMVEIPDAALERIELLKAQLQKAKDAGNDAAVAALEPLAGQKAMYNLDNNHYVNAMDLQGNIGILKLRHKAKLALDAEIKRLRDKGVEPLSVENGRFFVFRRNGMGRDTTFAVNTYMAEREIAGIGVVSQEVVHVLTDDILNRLEKEAGDLTKIARKLTSEEVERIVKTSELRTGISPAIDEIFGVSAAPAAEAVSEDPSEEEESNDVMPKSAVSGVITSTHSVGIGGTGILNTNSTGPAPVAHVPAPAPFVVQAAAPTPAPVATPSAPKAVAAVSEQSTEDFLKEFGL